jgi:recombinational DNA repair protein RecR
VIIDQPLELACQTFLTLMMRESMTRNPNRTDHTVPVWSELSVTDRVTLAKSIKGAVDVFNKIQAKTAANRQQTP